MVGVQVVGDMATLFGELPGRVVAPAPVHHGYGEAPVGQSGEPVRALFHDRVRVLHRQRRHPEGRDRAAGTDAARQSRPPFLREAGVGAPVARGALEAVIDLDHPPARRDGKLGELLDGLVDVRGGDLGEIAVPGAKARQGGAARRGAQRLCAGRRPFTQAFLPIARQD